MGFYETRTLEKFLNSRNRLIEDLDEGRLNKSQFLFENYMLVDRLNMKPFYTANTLVKCLYNYQYFNILAKYTRVYNKKRSRTEAQKLSELYYKKKDQTIIQLLQIEDIGRLEAYPLILHSTRLNGKLFEINLMDQKNIILHSLNDKIKNILINRRCFDFSARKSLIDSYVNQAY